MTSAVGATVLPLGKAQVASAATVKAAVTYKLVKQDETNITAGAKQIDYQWVSSDSSKLTQLVHVVQVDLTNPYVQLNAMTGKAGSVTARQSVGGMAKETGAVAGINGDVFNTATSSEGAPLGAEIRSGELISSTSKLTGMYAFGVTKDRTPIIDEFSFSGTVQAADGSTFPLTGVNKSAYKTEPDDAYSHADAMYIYTDNWTASQRPMNSGTTPTEALVVDGVVTEVSDGQEITTPVPENGYILRGHKSAADFIRTHLSVGTQVTSNYSLTSLTNGKTYDPSSFQMMVSGHTILVDNGKASSFSRDVSGLSGSSARARTAVGYSQDGKTAYLITVEENGGLKGVPLSQLQDIMVKLGVWKGVNMDGGGSTTMVTRPLGDFDVTLAHPTSFGTTQRQVADGIGVYTTAPQGAIKGIVASGEKTLFIGQQTNYALKAYDTYYNPIDPSGLTPTWSMDKAIGSFQNGVFQATKEGTAKLTVKAGSASDSVDIEVIGADQIDQLTIAPSTTLLAAGSSISVPVTARLKDGRELPVPASAIKWEFKGFTANAADGKITIQSVNEKATAAYAIARYQGFSTMVVLAPGTEKKLEDFENVGYTISYADLPSGATQGSVSLVTGLPGHETSKALDLKYDFTSGAGNKLYAYAMFNGGKGITVDGGPSAMTLDVSGDNSGNWLRAEFTDSKGAIKYATIADAIDWSGWKTVRVDLTEAGISYPAKLTKLYVVDPVEAQDERALQGEVAFDNLKLQYPPQTIKPQSTSVLLHIGSKTAKVGTSTVQLDAEPLVQKGTTYVPLRFISDALGGDTTWEQTLKRVTVLRGDRMLELWPGQSDLIANGVRVPAPSAPVVKNGRVLVPLRVVSEQLGLTVVWQAAAKSITIY
ncbi:stalk domain-containing protein [Cohnella zeiphila]|nr:stalk domain-containing protein [Cohnella zeiphila]